MDTDKYSLHVGKYHHVNSFCNTDFIKYYFQYVDCVCVCVCVCTHI